MPIIVFEGPKLEKGQKAELIKSFTQIASGITKIPQESFSVIIRENDPENVGVGGVLLADRRRG